MNSALLLIDIQNDYFEGGKNELHFPMQAAENASKVLEAFRSASKSIFHIQHINKREGATFFLPDSEGICFHKSVTPLPNEKILTKYAPNAFLNTDLAAELKNQDINHLVICGMMSHMCIDTSVRAAKDFNFSVTVLEDACATKDLIWHDTVITANQVQGTIMASLNGVFAKVLPTNEFLNDIQG